MSPRRDRLAALASLAAIMADRALLPVAQAQARLDAARAQVEAIAQARAMLDADMSIPVQAARAARQAEQLRLRQAGAMSALARCQADLEIAKSTARPAYGRKIVLEKLLATPSRKR